ncbi:MAG: sortase-like [Geobacteraceae bacterium]|nr:MAG: sortase-like [Geobacteraceae bacterium]
MNIRIARSEDLHSIVAIYNQSINGNRSTADLTPVRPEDRRGWFAEHTPDKYPVYVAEIDGVMAGWCSISAYRPGRMALRFTAEISYYIDNAFHRQGIASELIRRAIASCGQLQIKNLFAIVLERNEASVRLLEKTGFEKWGCLPRVADFGGEECGHLYYGMRVWDPAI